MSMHISAKPGEIAPNVLLPGDPLRAKYIAEKFLEDAVCINEIRGMYGYTGTYRGQKVTVMATGMGIPSMMIYATELCREYGCRKLVRIGTAGNVSEKLQVGDLVMSGEEFAQMMGLNSAYLSVEYRKDSIKITSKGVGMGFGMSLYTANIMSLDGENYQKIIKHFYPECIILSL